MKAFINSQFAYAPLVSLFFSRTMNNKINKLHYRALKCVYQDDFSTFQELLDKDESVTIHHRSIQCLAIELYKVKSGNAPHLLNDIFQTRDIPENSVAKRLRSHKDFYNHQNPKTFKFGTETLRALGPKIWDLIPSHIKGATSVNAFRMLIKSWIPNECPCRKCQIYLAGVGFI